MIRDQTKKQSNKFVKIVTCVGDCATKECSDGAVFCPVPKMNLPRSFNVSSGNYEEIRQLLISISDRRRACEVVPESNLNMHTQSEVNKVSKSTCNWRYNEITRVGVGKLGTIIEEEQPLFYEED